MKTVLLVEDDQFNTNVLEDVFEFDEIPAELVCVGSGESALALANELQPALILMDIGLPGINGITTTKMLREQEVTKHIPIWGLTACAMQCDIDAAFEIGFAEYFTKPLDCKKLSLTLQGFLAASLVSHSKTN